MAAPTSRLGQLKEMLAFLADQVQQFWPPYRIETEPQPAESTETAPEHAPVCRSKPERSHPVQQSDTEQQPQGCA
jgi:hypothetical protein